MNLKSKLFHLLQHIRFLLLPLVPLYITGFYLKKFLSRPVKCNVPVICAGNITTGGTGKTPLVIFLAEKLIEAGFNPGIVSRGYKGSKSREGALVTDGKDILLSPAEAGDEPYLSALKLKGVPVAVGKDRLKSISMLSDYHGVNVIIMDDGFQNYTVYKDVSIIAVDALNPFGNGLILPAGNLRESKKSLKRGGIVFINKSDLISDENLDKLYRKICNIKGDRKVFRGKYCPDHLYHINNPDCKLPPESLRNKALAIVTGVANPESVQQMLKNYNPASIKLYPFPDHYVFKAGDISSIHKISGKNEYIIVTEKDYTKLKDFNFHQNVFVLRVSLKIKNDGEFINEIFTKIKLDKKRTIPN